MQNSKIARFIWVFIVLGTHNFVNSWCGCGKTAWCDARIDISKWIFIAIDVHFKPLPESFSVAGYGKFHLKIKKCFSKLWFVKWVKSRKSLIRKKLFSRFLLSSRHCANCHIYYLHFEFSIVKLFGALLIVKIIYSPNWFEYF